MFGVQKDVNLDFLVEKKLLSVSFLKHSFSLFFEDEIKIQVEAAVSFKPANVKLSQHHRIETIANRLVELIDKNITSYSVLDDKRILLNFSNADELVLIDDSEEYESFTITHRDRFIVV